ncbi:MAG TPA: TetR/AcrR family transcriptional regulator [Acidimicrobiales bacterium]|jgi:AcrR family transcriptional regulator
MNVDDKDPGRPGQRRRTRKAIVDATARLVEQGLTPTVADIADAADVSRRTVYLYFPTLEQLLIDATLGALSQADVDRVLELPELSDDVGARVEAVARALQSMSPDVERLGRTLIRLTVESGATGDGDVPMRRGYRRVEWIERALAPLRDRVDDTRYERLVSALAMVVGWEALIVQRDIRGLTADEGEELSVWTARALVQATLAEASPFHASSTSQDDVKQA